jgi:hypothetical protein
MPKTVISVYAFTFVLIDRSLRNELAERFNLTLPFILILLATSLDIVVSSDGSGSEMFGW